LKKLSTGLQLLFLICGFFLIAFVLASITDAPVDEETLQRLQSSRSESYNRLSLLQKLLLQEQLLIVLIISVVVLLLMAHFLKEHHRRRKQRTFLERQRRLREQLRSEPEGLNFEQRLLREFPELSAYELELSKMLLEHPSSKEIAQKLNIDPASVNTARYRLRKKLELQKGEDLVKFLLLFQK
jgi:DNA-binding CsgD family transcriptional regulator/membrane protein implicated in regulation of membrane protease activity